MLLTDKFGRAITDLRISITDRCNYKCVYCRTGNEGAFYGELPFPDYLRMARVLVSLGIRKIRLTGGEPLLRKGIVDFVRELRKLEPQGLKPEFQRTASRTAEAVPSRGEPTRTVAVPFPRAEVPEGALSQAGGPLAEDISSASSAGAAQLSPARERWEIGRLRTESRRDD